MPRQAIHTDQAPKAIGPYSQAVRVGDTVYMAGQIPLDPATMQMVEGDFEAEARRVFENIKAVIAATFADGNAGPSPTRTWTPRPEWSPRSSFTSTAMPHAPAPATPTRRAIAP